MCLPPLPSPCSAIVCHSVLGGTYTIVSPRRVVLVGVSFGTGYNNRVYRVLGHTTRYLRLNYILLLFIRRRTVVIVYARKTGLPWRGGRTAHTRYPVVID